MDHKSAFLVLRLLYETLTISAPDPKSQNPKPSDPKPEASSLIKTEEYNKKLQILTKPQHAQPPEGFRSSRSVRNVLNTPRKKRKSMSKQS